MYRKTREVANQPEKFKLPFEGKLASDNRWVVMANLIPWSEFEEEYAALFAEEIGAPAKSFRMARSSVNYQRKAGKQRQRNSFGQAKRRFSLARVMAKLPHTSLDFFSKPYLKHNLHYNTYYLHGGTKTDWSKAISYLGSKASLISKLLLGEVPDNLLRH
jgi:hypothetical protein